MYSPEATVVVAACEPFTQADTSVPSAANRQATARVGKGVADGVGRGMPVGVGRREPLLVGVGTVINGEELWVGVGEGTAVALSNAWTVDCTRAVMVASVSGASVASGAGWVADWFSAIRAWTVAARSGGGVPVRVNSPQPNTNN